jgi:hypothetical protein
MSSNHSLIDLHNFLNKSIFELKSIIDINKKETIINNASI